MVTQFSVIAKNYETSLFDYSPELGLFWGKMDVDNSRFTDYSPQALAQWQKQEDDFLQTLTQIDENALIGTSSYYTFLLFKEMLENKQASRICREELWEVNPVWGWHNKMAIVAEKQPVGSPEYRQIALKRWNTFAKVTDNQIENLKTGLNLGYNAPKPAVDRVITQLTIVLQTPIEDSPYFSLAKRDNDAAFKETVKTLITQTINPSLQKYRDYLVTDYLPQARASIGVSALPHGKQCYLAKIKQETTLTISPQAIHELGLQHMRTVTQEIAAIGLKQYGTSDIQEIFKLASKDPANYFDSEKSLLDYNLKALQKAKAEASNWFGQLPIADGTVEPYPLYRAITGASGEYHPPSQDGTKPGVFFINTYKPQKRNRMDQEATLFHELIPGHHLQIALSHENKSLPDLNKYLWNSGFGEGWGLYAERLADEMGLYQDDISKLGMLSNESMRTARLVVDTGIHMMGWPREKAVRYLTEHTALAPYIIEGEVDRYIMMPAQATAYMLGKQEIEQLRRLAQKTLGSRFDIREFHNEVITHGVFSLPLLRKHIETWISIMHSK
ncbi:MAG: DUF885 domain-containing protein [Silvanigrellaceae bacterium]|nr:DUF885 domain-containing protein [Silvanigrellaceae bacterium]